MTAEPARARRGPAPRFSREQVFAKALEVIDAGPPDAFSMRRLAEALGVNPMTLYGYADSKEKLIEGATLFALADIHHEPPASAPWDAHLRAAMWEIHVVCRRHPNLATLIIGRGSQAPGMFRIRERVLAGLLSAGFDEDTALRALGVLSYYALGFGGGQAALAATPPTEMLPALSADEFPTLSRLRERYPEHASDEAFEYGLDLLLDGLRRQLRDLS